MERRKYARVKVEERGMVALHNDANRIGKLRDIGLGGLSFEHIYEEDLVEGEAKTLTLLIEGVNLTKIPCRIIYNHELPVPREYDHLAIRLTTRRCGIAFESLTDQQIALLEHLLTASLKTSLKETD